MHRTEDRISRIVEDEIVGRLFERVAMTKEVHRLSLLRVDRRSSAHEVLGVKDCRLLGGIIQTRTRCEMDFSNVEQSNTTHIGEHTEDGASAVRNRDERSVEAVEKRDDRS